jgi:hypothetical protein
MIVNAAVFTCSICGEASVNICSYCTKDACSNHRCERCKRCSDCCECEYPLSAEEPAEVEVVTEPESVFEPEPAPVSSVADFLTPEESSVFAPEDESIEADPTEPSDPTEPRASSTPGDDRKSCTGEHRLEEDRTGGA